MSAMRHRTTLVLDDASIEGIRKLAHAWGVSQSEAVRRAVRQAAERSDADRKAPLERLQAFHQMGGLDRRKADAYLDEVAEARRTWRSSP